LKKKKVLSLIIGPPKVPPNWTEIVQNNGIRRMPEMYGDLSAVWRLNSAKRMNSLIRLVAKISGDGSADDFLLHRRVDQHIVFDETA
jgi:hypothetical protein